MIIVFQNCTLNIRHDVLIKRIYNKQKQHGHVETARARSTEFRQHSQLVEGSTVNQFSTTYPTLTSPRHTTQCETAKKASKRKYLSDGRATHTCNILTAIGANWYKQRQSCPVRQDKSENLFQSYK